MALNGAVVVRAYGAAADESKSSTTVSTSGTV